MATFVQKLDDWLHKRYLTTYYNPKKSNKQVKRLRKIHKPICTIRGTMHPEDITYRGNRFKNGE